MRIARTMGRAGLGSDGTRWMTSELWLVMDALATHRITHLITEDEFPFGPVRDRILASRPNSMIAAWVTCPWCSGLWCAAGVVAVRAFAPRWWAPVATALAFSSITGLLSTWENK